MDVENLNRAISLDIARSFFAPAEADYLDALPPQHRQETFFAFWTLKEAYIKACGQGLSLALNRFAFTLDPVSISFAPDLQDDPMLWQFIHLRPTPDHLLAVAVRLAAGETLAVTSQETILLTDAARGEAQQRIRSFHLDGVFDSPDPRDALRHSDGPPGVAVRYPRTR